MWYIIDTKQRDVITVTTQEYQRTVDGKTETVPSSTLTAIKLDELGNGIYSAVLAAGIDKEYALAYFKDDEQVSRLTNKETK